jgi:hypothetical protein
MYWHWVGLVSQGLANVVAFTDAPLEMNNSVERLWRNEELAKADIGFNIATDTDDSAVLGWSQYREDLRNWPEDANFPDINYRPTYVNSGA